MAVTVESALMHSTYLLPRQILDPRHWFSSISLLDHVYPRNRNMAYKLLGLSSINDIERKLVRGDRWTVTAACSKKCLIIKDVCVDAMLNRKKDNNCRYGYVNEFAQQSTDDYSLSLYGLKLSQIRVRSWLLFPLHRLLLTLSPSWERNNNRAVFLFADAKKALDQCSINVTINQSPAGASRSAALFCGSGNGRSQKEEERENRQTDGQRERERANSISQPCLPFRYVPLYNVTYSTVATLRLIKSVLTPANAFLDPRCGSVERARSFYGLSLRPGFSHENHGETRRAYAISVYISNLRYSGWSRFRENTNLWLMREKNFSLIIVSQDVSINWQIIRQYYCKISHSLT